LPAEGILAVFPAARFRPVKVRAFVDVLLAEEKQCYPSRELAPRRKAQ